MKQKSSESASEVRARPAVKRSAVWSLELALPLAFISFAVADSETIANSLRYFISPGHLVAVTLQGHGSFSESIVVALASNALYYGVLLFLILSRRR
jgi:hypothetical protein